ncbi:MAG: hypothetical protein LC777_11920 [Actinobacteria bacterium]|nr:hypothetical protein [Actinomycetota bacterium]
MRAQRDEAVRLHPPAALEHLGDGRAEVVVANEAEGAAEELECLSVRLQERLLGLARVCLHETAAREAGSHQEQEHLRLNAADHHLSLAPVDLRLSGRLVAERNEHLIDDVAQRAPPGAHIAARLTLYLKKGRMSSSGLICSSLVPPL